MSIYFPPIPYIAIKIVFLLWPKSYPFPCENTRLPHLNFSSSWRFLTCPGNNSSFFSSLTLLQLADLGHLLQKQLLPLSWISNHNWWIKSSFFEPRREEREKLCIHNLYFYGAAPHALTPFATLLLSNISLGDFFSCSQRLCKILSVQRGLGIKGDAVTVSVAKWAWVNRSPMERSWVIFWVILNWVILTQSRCSKYVQIGHKYRRNIRKHTSKGKLEADLHPKGWDMQHTG